MTGQKGGHKDRIRAWKMLYRKRRQEKLLLQDAMARQKKEEKKKQKELELQYRLTWKERTKAFFHTSFGLVLGLFTSRTQTLEKQIVLEVKPGKTMVLSEADGIKLEAFQREVSYIERKMKMILDTIDTMTQDKILDLKENIEKKKKTLSGIQYEYENTKKKYGNQHLKKEEVADLIPMMKESKISVREPIHLEKGIQKAEEVLLAAESIVLIKEKEMKESFKKKKSKHGVEAKKTKENKNDVLVADYIKTTTKNINQKAKEIESIGKKLKSETDPFEFQGLKSKLKNLKEEIFHMKLLYHEMDRQYGFYRFGIDSKACAEDQWNLLKNGFIFDGLLDEITEVLQIEFKEVKPNKKQVGKKEQKEKEKKEKEKNPILIELDLADDVIQKHIEQQENRIKELQKELAGITSPKGKMKRTLNRFGQAILNVGKMITGLFSFRFFKQKAVGILTGAFLIQNGIRGLKNIVSKEQESYYELSHIKNMIKSQNDCIRCAGELLEESTSEIEKVKQSLMENYSGIKNTFEYQNAMAQILHMERLLSHQKKKLERERQKLENEKNKVKKLEKEKIGA